MLGYEIANDKKADKIMAEIKGKTMEQIKGMENVKSCETKRISFSAPAYISATASNEPAISAIAGKLNVGQESAPIKGNNGVYVIKLVAKNAKGGEFNAKSEEDAIKAIRLAVESSAVILISGLAIARGTDGKPAPQPTSITVEF